MNIFKKIHNFLSNCFPITEVKCPECGEDYMIGVPDVTHKCNLKTVIKKAILEIEEEKLNKIGK